MSAVRAGRKAKGSRAVSRIVTLVLAVGFAVVGAAGAANAHHNTVEGKVTCKDGGGGWVVTWKVTNSESIPETITVSNRKSVVAEGTWLNGSQTKTFTEYVTSKPSSALNLTLTGKWVRDGQNIYSTNGDSVEVGEFSDGCKYTTVTAPTVPVIDDSGPGNARFGAVPSGPWTSRTNTDGSLTVTANQGYKFTNGQTTVTYLKPKDSNTPCPVAVPSVPVIDDCGPGNARYGTVPAGQWTSVVNPDGSLTITANPGYAFPNGQQSVTLPVPTDSNVACPTPPVTPPVVTPPVVTPPVVVPPEVLPAQVLVVKAGARRIDKCGRQGDLFKVAKKSGVVYTAKGKVLRQGVWLKARTRTVTVRASAADATYQLRGKSVWKLSFTRKACAKAPEVAPNTGS
jgi:hypothetical protein